MAVVGVVVGVGVLVVVGGDQVTIFLQKDFANLELVGGSADCRENRGGQHSLTLTSTRI